MPLRVGQLADLQVRLKQSALPERLAGLVSGIRTRQSHIPQLAIVEHHQVVAPTHALAPFDEHCPQLTPFRQALRTGGGYAEGHKAHGFRSIYPGNHKGSVERGPRVGCDQRHNLASFRVCPTRRATGQACAWAIVCPRHRPKIITSGSAFSLAPTRESTDLAPASDQARAFLFCACWSRPACACPFGERSSKSDAAISLRSRLPRSHCP
jgi:hypothetical protein